MGCAVFVTVSDEIEVALDTADTEAAAAAAVLAKLCEVTTVPMFVEDAGETTDGGGGALEDTGVLLTGGCCFFLRESL